MNDKPSIADEELEAKILKAIEDNNILFFSHVCGFVSYSSSTLYERGMAKSDIIKSALEKNRISVKKKMLSNWVDSDNATLQIAGYKLVSDDIEHSKLTGQSIDHTTKGDKLEGVRVEIFDTKDKGD